MRPRDEDMSRPLRACAHGDLPANVALMQIVQAASRYEEVELHLQKAIRICDRLGDDAASERLGEVVRLWRETPQAWTMLRAVLVEADVADCQGAASIRRWAKVFDRVCAISPEAGVALYSLGRPDLLEAATREIVDLMRRWGLLGRGKVALDVGCGTGRFLTALAAEIAVIIGVDISQTMLREARLRCAGLVGISVIRSSGQDLAMFAEDSFDLIYAVDSFPYLVQAGEGIAYRHVAEAARIMKPGGDLLIFNYSYRGSPERDCADLARLSRQAGLQLLADADADVRLRHWDGAVYRLRR